MLQGMLQGMPQGMLLGTRGRCGCLQHDERLQVQHLEVTVREIKCLQRLSNAAGALTHGALNTIDHTTEHTADCVHIWYAYLAHA